MLFPMRFFLRFIVPLFLAIGLLAYSAVPLVDRLMLRWFTNDLELRSRLITNAMDSTLFATIDENSKSKAQAFFDRMAQDERLFALGFCDTDAKQPYKTKNFPEQVQCTSITDGVEPPSRIIQEPKGPLHVSYHALQGSGRTLGTMVLVHDMSFAQSRSTLTNRYIMYTFLVVGVIIAMITLLMVKLTWRGWVADTRALLRDKSRRHHLLNPRGAPRELQPIAQELRDMLREMETSRRRKDESQMDWNPRSLKEFLHEELSGDEIIVVSNREPYIHVKKDKKIEVLTPASGLVTALEPIMRACSGTWVAHGSGSGDRDVVDKEDHVYVPPERPAYRIRRVWLTEKEEEGYYYGFSNEGLWPLCHNSYVRPTFRSGDWEEYKRVNQKFADAILEEVKTKDPVILVQDYLLALLPRMIREKLPEATIITFWHIPWPNPETFGVCPWTEELLDGLLGSSIVGFHTRQHDLNFSGTVERYLECRVDRSTSTISYQGELTSVNHYPISIEFPSRLLRHAKSVNEARALIRKKYDVPADLLLGVGVDRLDYTKGIAEKFLAVERLFELHPEWIGKFSFLQIAAPSRSRLESYQRLQTDVQAEADRINARFGKGKYLPVILRVEHREAASVLDYYRAAELCFVNSLHDGMNLVSKEFAAARDDEQGVLILSKFTGAAREFPEALIVNPYHVDQCAAALHAALSMPPEEQRDRMRSLRGFLREFNIFRWAGRMLMDAARMRQRNRFLARIGGTNWDPSEEE